MQEANWLRCPMPRPSFRAPSLRRAENCESGLWSARRFYAHPRFPVQTLPCRLPLITHLAHARRSSQLPRATQRCPPRHFIDSRSSLCLSFSLLAAGAAGAAWQRGQSCTSCTSETSAAPARAAFASVVRDAARQRHVFSRACGTSISRHRSGLGEHQSRA
jgi:hypothetical protein